MEGGKMKKKVMLVALLCVIGLAALSIGNAEAAGPWYTCKISQAGSNWIGYVVTLTDTASPATFTDVSFVIDTGYGKGKEIYAAALTALATYSNVVAYMSYTTPGAKCYAIYVTK
jgi:hypothetical protein